MDELAAELPEEFYKELNGGIILLQEAKPHPENRGDGLYIMGEYYKGGNLGRYIAIYYGSFMRAFGNIPAERFKEQLRKTLRHEFRHHLESLAGVRGIEIEDEEYLAQYLQRHGRNSGR